MESREKKCDIVIIGGGLIGGTLSQSLAQFGFDTIVIDENDTQTRLNTNSDNRSYAVSLGSKRILDSIGLWDPLNEKAHPIETIQIGSEASELPLTYHYTEVTSEPFGYLVNASKLNNTILMAALKQEGIEWIENTTVSSFTPLAEKVSIRTSRGDLIHCKLVIAADGGHSKTREVMNIPTTQWKYDQLALVFNVEHTKEHNNSAIEIFTSEGPFAMLPYPGNHSGCVWSLKKKYAEDFLQLSEEEMTETLNLRFEGLFGQCKLVTPVKSFQLKVKQPHSYIRPRFTLIGDAAHMIHPVAGQGLNLGFRDIKVLSAELHKAAQLGLDIGNQSVLETYQRKRRFDNLSLLAVTDFSARGFLTQNFLARRLFSKGFNALNSLPTVKKYMMRHAMGMFDEISVFNTP